MTMTSPYLNSQEAADILRISIRTLERMRVEGGVQIFSHIAVG